MREYSKKPENQSRTLDSNPKASRQAPIDVIFQRYKERNIQRFAEDEELIPGKFDTVQREEMNKDEILQSKFETVSSSEQEYIQREEKSNNTGLLNNLKIGIESLSGFSMDDVQVHYNSDKPAQLNVLAYAQGTDIHVASGQEKHLPHEAWHVVQQKQGRVQSTMQLRGVNDDERLEKEADAISSDFSKLSYTSDSGNSVGYHSTIIQMLHIMNDGKTYKSGTQWTGTSDSITQIDLGDNQMVLNFLENYNGYNLYWEAIPTPLRGIIKAKGNLALWKASKWYKIKNTSNSYIYFYPDDIEKIKGTKSEEPLWITMGYYATGDQFSVAMTLLNETNTNVLICTDKPLDSTPSMFDFFHRILDGRIEEQCIAGSTIRCIVVGDKRRVIYQPHGITLNLTNASDPKATLSVVKSFSPTASVNYATDFVASSFNKNMRDTMRSKLLERTERKFEQIETYLIRKCQSDSIKRDNIKEKDILVIWLRFSGSKGGAHPEHDTSFTLTRSIIDKYSSHYIILAGDKKDSKTSEMKSKRVFDLTEFWTEQETEIWGGKDRIGQLNLYEYFKVNAKSVKHIGSRSGNLELMAFLGYPVEYFEEENSFGGKRMETYHLHDSLVTSDDKIGYTRTTFAMPPTIKGKLLRSVTEQLTKEDRQLLETIASKGNYEDIKKTLLDVLHNTKKGESPRSKIDSSYTDVLALIENFSKIKYSENDDLTKRQKISGYEYVETIQKDAYPVNPKTMTLLNILVQLASKEYKYILRNYQSIIKDERKL